MIRLPYPGCSPLVAFFALVVSLVSAQAGEPWQVLRAADNTPLRSIATDRENLIVAVGPGAIVRSANAGETWTRTSVQGELFEVAFLEGRFYAVGRLNSRAAILTSVNGSDWTTINPPGAYDSPLRGIAFGGGRFVAVGSAQVAVSSDGDNWTMQHATGLADFVSVSYGNGRFLAVATSGWAMVQTSDDGGQTWTVQPFQPTGISSFGFRQVRFHNGRFVATTSHSSTANLITSSDGRFWHGLSPEPASLHAVAMGDGVWLAAGEGCAFFSSDGRYWSARHGGISGTVTGLAGGDQTILAAQSNGAILRRSSAFAPAVPTVLPYTPAGHVPPPPVRLVGEALDLFAVASGTGAIAYQWLRKHQPLTGETGPRLRREAVTMDDAGTYTCVATGPAGSSTVFSRTIHVAESPPDGHQHWLQSSVNLGGEIGRPAHHDGVTLAPVNLSSQSGTGIAVSPDGRRWTLRRLFDGTHIRRVGHFDGRWFAAGTSASNSPALWTSPDGYIWDRVVLPQTVVGTMLDMTFGHGQYLLLTHRIYRSSDLVEWVELPDTHFINGGLAFGNGRFVAHGSDRSAWSDNGIDWTFYSHADPGNPLRDLLFADGRFVASWAAGTRTVLLATPDGELWVEKTPPGDVLNDAQRYGLAALPRGGLATATTSGAIAMTADGWRWIVSPAGNLAVRQLAAPNDRLLGAAGAMFYERPLGLPAEVYRDLPENPRRHPAGPARLEISAAGPGPVSFQWQLGGEDIPGATERFLDVSAGDPAGPYRALVRNPWGEDTSTASTLESPFGGSNPSQAWALREQAPFSGSWNLAGVAAADDRLVAILSDLGQSRIELFGGRLWTGGRVFPDIGLRSIVYGNGRYVAMDSLRRIYSSPDGVLWSRSSTPLGNPSAIVFTGADFLALGGGVVWRSSDGVSWQSVGTFQQSITHATWGPAGGVAVNDERRVFFSLDGTSWGQTGFTASQPVTVLRQFEGIYFLAGAFGLVATSSDGVVWETGSTGSGPEAGLRTAVYDHGLWIAIAGNAPQTRLLISSDGLNWITRLTSNVHIAQIAPLGAELVGISPPARYNRTRWFPPAVVGTLVMEVAAEAGADLTLTLPVQGSQPMIYQWQFEGEDISGAETLVFDLQNLDTSMAGEYRLRVANQGGHITSSPITVRVLTRYDLWRDEHFGPESADNPDAAPTADPGGQGVPNLLRYGYGFEGEVLDRGRLPSVSREPAALVLQFQRLRDTADLVWVIEGSPDLAEWDPVVPDSITVEPLKGGLEQVTVRQEIGETDKRFVRIHLEQGSPNSSR